MTPACADPYARYPELSALVALCAVHPRAAAEKLARMPEGPAVLHLRAEALVRAGAVREALPLFLRALSLDPHWARGAAGSRGLHLGRPSPCPSCSATEGEPSWAGNLAVEGLCRGLLPALRCWLRCSSCGLDYDPEPPSPELLELWASRGEPQGPPAEERLHADLMACDQLIERIRDIGYGERWVHREGGARPLPRLLELGAGWGVLLAAADWRGFQALGLDGDESGRYFAYARLGQHIELGPPRGAWPEDIFDVVVLTSCLDRVASPRALLEEATAHLERGGLLVVSVPSLDHPLHRTQGARAPGWRDPQRRCWFQRPTLARTMVEAGLQPLGSWYDPREPGSIVVVARPEQDIRGP